MVLMSNLWFEVTVKLVVRDEAHTISLQTQVLNLEIRNMTCLIYLGPYPYIKQKVRVMMEISDIYVVTGWQDLAGFRRGQQWT